MQGVSGAGAPDGREPGLVRLPPRHARRRRAAVRRALPAQPALRAAPAPAHRPRPTRWPTTCSRATRGAALLRAAARAAARSCCPSTTPKGKAYLTVGVGCTGGRHRSVAVVEALAARAARRRPRGERGAPRRGEERMKPGVVIVTHYRLGEEFLQALRLIVPDAPRVPRGRQSSRSSRSRRCAPHRGRARGGRQGHGVLVLTDMFGGTPSNIALSFLDEHRVEVVTGVNLPMLIKLATLARGEAARGARLVHQELRAAQHLGGERDPAGRGAMSDAGAASAFHRARRARPARAPGRARSWCSRGASRPRSRSRARGQRRLGERPQRALAALARRRPRHPAARARRRPRRRAGRRGARPCSKAAASPGPAGGGSRAAATRAREPASRSC